jgi:transposase
VSCNFVSVDRDQLMLMPPSMTEWLPEDHLVWFVLDVVDEFDLSAFVARYRADGRGGAAYHPAMMVALLVYAYAVGERSSRSIQRRCVEDVAFRVAAANHAPDHATIARFRATHEAALAGLFAQVLVLCTRAGVLRPGLVAIDGTKLAANASKAANRTAEQLAAEILAEADAVDAAEDAAAEPAPEMPEAMRRRGERRKARLRELLAELEAEAEEKSYEAHLAHRAETEAGTGRPIRGRRPSPDSAAHQPRRQANVTDPDSRLLKVQEGFVQGYNAQAVATEDQFVIAAEVSGEVNDAPAFEPMINQAQANLRAAGEQQPVCQVLADAGYWSIDNANLAGIEALIAPGRRRQLRKISEADTTRSALLARVEAGEIDKVTAIEQLGVTRERLNQLLRRRRQGEPETLTTAMITKLGTPEGRTLYKKRAATIEPVFAQIKHNRKIRNLARRGLSAVDSEWKLICATHNILKLSRLA